MATRHEIEALGALEASPWFGEGLRFTCTGCGKCCTGSAGAVYLSDDDVERLCGFLGLSRDAFLARYTRSRDGKRALVDKASSDECVFLSGTACSVYDARADAVSHVPVLADERPGARRLGRDGVGVRGDQPPRSAGRAGARGHRGVP